MKKSIKIILMVSLFFLLYGHGYGYYVEFPSSGILLHSDESEIYYNSLTTEYSYGVGGNFWGGVNETMVILEPGDLPTEMVQVNIYYYFSESFDVTLNNFTNDPNYFPPSSYTPATLMYTEVQTRALGNTDFAVHYSYISYMDSLISNHRTLGNIQPPPIDPNINAYAYSESLQQYWINVDVSNVPTPIPATVWLLCSGLLGLVGIRRKIKS